MATVQKRAKKKPAKAAKERTVEELQAQLDRYEEFFGEIDHFVDFVRDRKDNLGEAIAEEAKAKDAYERARDARRELESSIASAKDSLYQLVEPGIIEFMPLLDRMEPTNTELHGEHAGVWRKEPIAALRLSPHATRFLIESDIIVVGQLQDRVLADPSEWYLSIDGITAAIAAAIVDQLNDFIFKREQGGTADE